MLFCNFHLKHSFLNCMNPKHENVKFTAECEENDKLSFFGYASFPFITKFSYVCL